VSNCHLVAARSLIDLAASRLAFRAPARAAAAFAVFSASTSGLRWPARRPPRALNEVVCLKGARERKRALIPQVGANTVAQRMTTTSSAWQLVRVFTNTFLRVLPAVS
jgi:hypothetical protein